MMNDHLEQVAMAADDAEDLLLLRLHNRRRLERANRRNNNDDDNDDDENEENQEGGGGDGNRDNDPAHEEELEDQEDDEEEEDDEDEDDEEDENDNDEENENENENGAAAEEEDSDIIDGGTTEHGSKQPSTSCPMFVILECKEWLPTSLVPRDFSLQALNITKEPRGKEKDTTGNNNDADSNSADADANADADMGGDNDGEDAPAAANANPNANPRVNVAGGIFPHPIYSPGSKVQIGLEKSTRLSAVFARYCEFANNYLPNTRNNHKDTITKYNSKLQYKPLQVEPYHLEFSHCSILKPSDTAETSALMKEDKITVRRVRKEERRSKADWTRTQRDSDQSYFKQLRGLLPDNSQNATRNCDVVFHCRGKIKDENGYKQEVLTTYVRGHAALLSKRCKWLALRIDAAKGEFYGAGDDRDNNNRNAGDNDHVNEGRHGENEDHDMQDQEDMVFEANQNQNPNHNNNLDNNGNNNNMDNNDNNNHNENDNGGGNNVVPIVDDEEDDRDNAVHKIHDSADGTGTDSSLDMDDNSHGRNRNRSRNVRDSPLQFVGSNYPNHILRVPLSHPPEAIRLLLEYCYTNRVIALGSLAFHESYKPIDKQNIDPLLADLCGPVSPFPTPRGLRSAWPLNGLPTISLSVALAGIQLAEEANLPRLSYMCEIAASQLISANTALEVLALCEQQYRATGNHLTHLRKAVMLYYVLGRGRKGVSDLSSKSSFKRTLKEKSEDVVPSLLMGIQETVKHVLGGGGGSHHDHHDHRHHHGGDNNSLDHFHLLKDSDYERKITLRRKSTSNYLKA